MFYKLLLNSVVKALVLFKLDGKQQLCSLVSTPLGCTHSLSSLPNHMALAEVAAEAS